MKLAAGCVLGLLCASALAVEPPQRTLSFEERVAAQTAIEQVYWNHREWPKANPGPKPAMSAVIPESLIRAKVDNYLRQSAALETIWNSPLTPKQLQAELDRMADHSRDVGLLRELFDALGNDPVVVAETLARETLVDRLIRNWFAFDLRFHGDLKHRIELAQLACQDVECMKSMGGEYRETVWRLDTSDLVGPQLTPGDSAIRLDPTAWSDRLVGLARMLGASPASLPVGRLGQLEDTRDHFAVTAILSKSAAELTTAEVNWRKTAFDEWWTNARVSYESAVHVSSAGFSLPTLAGEPCVSDAWLPTWNDSPDAAGDLTSVWTGAEMIVWSDSVGDVNRYNPATDTWSATSFAGGPNRTHAASAVWSGTEMIVWGGSDGSCGRNTGGRYNPSTDTWTATSTGGDLPEGRSYHAAIWTGTTMIVWGGFRCEFDPLVPLNSGGRYDPATDSWVATATGPAVPEPRAVPSAVWTGNKMIVWGGHTGTSQLATGGLYDPSSNTWASTSIGANAPSARANHAAIWTGTEMLVWGGNLGNGFLNSGSRYNPTTDAWATISPVGAPSPRTSHSGVWTGERMIVWGGMGQFGFTNSGGRYDPVTDVWTPTSLGPNVPESRAFHTAVWTGAEMIVWGGGNSFRAMNTGGRYNPSTNTWIPTSTGTVPLGRQNHVAIWTGTEMIVWGGIGGESGGGGRYNPALDRWSPTATLNAPVGRFHHTGVWTGTTMIVWGGQVVGGPPLNDGGRYNPIADTWAAGGTGSGGLTPRFDHSAVWTGTEMIIWGKVNAGDGARYNPQTNGWNEVSSANAPLERGDHSAVWTGTEMIVWGGTYHSGNGSAYRNSGGRYEPSTDTWRPTSIGAGVPQARSSHTAVWTGTKMIVWGGGNLTERFDEGGVYDPSSDAWTTASTGAQSPAGRFAHSAVWSGTSMIVWGGYNFGAFNSGGRYDPSTDSWLATSMGTGVPSPRYYHTAVWTGTAMIVWGGGSASGGQYLLDTTVDLDGDGYSICQGDCDDSSGSVFPSAPQVCDGVNNDCADPAWPTAPSIDADTDRDGFSVCEGDCDDARAATYPGARELCNGIDDDCDLAVDDGGATQCNDGNPCTDDSCDSATGCVFVPFTHACDDGDPCTSGDNCGSGACAGVPISGSVCDDADVCTAGDFCVSGQCEPGPGILDCDDQNVCTDDSCDPVTGCVHDSAQVGDSCDDGNPCTFNACDPVLFCIFPPAPAGGACSDFDPCTHADNCDGAGFCVGQSPCDDQNPCTDDFADANASCSCSHEPSYPGTVCSSGACAVGGTCDGLGSLNSCLGESPRDCDDNNPCTVDSCDPATGCVHTNSTAACDDSNACTESDACDGGQCLGAALSCDDDNPCTVDSCDPTTGCVRTNSTTACDDGNACTQTDLCANGTCVGSNPVVCLQTDPCHSGGSCDPSTGACSGTIAPDGTACDDHDLCTAGETCLAGTCTPAFTGLNEPNPRTNGYYKSLCHGSHSGDSLTDADAVCVSTVAHTFAGVSTVADLCAELTPSHPNNDACDRTDDDLMVLALNICRARVCTAQSIDSQCGGNASVGQSLAESDEILGSSSRNAATCAHAKCLDEEINTGSALELNSLTLRVEAGAIRLDWSPPYLNDGGGHPSRYNVWRRPQGSSLRFRKIGETTEPTFIDLIAGSGAFQYEVTAVMD